MTKEVVIQLRDDLTKEPGADVSTREFTIEGIAYEIELGDANYAEFLSATQRFVDAARRKVTQKRRNAPPKKHGQAEIRKWAVANGYEVPARGWVPKHITKAYREAQLNPEEAD